MGLKIDEKLIDNAFESDRRIRKMCAYSLFFSEKCAKPRCI